jgi:hypothetical protein
MGKVHGQNTFISLNGVDLSSYGTSVEMKRSADAHDVTTFGNNSHRKAGGLFDGAATIQGLYDNVAAVSPRAVIEPIIGTVVALIERPEGTGVGKPQRGVNVLITNYDETNPVADYVTWQCEVEFDGFWLNSTQ